MAAEYGRLDLRREIKIKDGVTSKEVVIYRPSCRDISSVMDESKVSAQVNQFVTHCCRAVNGTGAVYDFASADLDAADAAELCAVIVELPNDSEKIDPSSVVGDGINEPMVYSLRHPIKMAPTEDAEVVRQIEFQARRIGELSDFLDARGATAEFYAFMHAFAHPLGTKLPMTDALIGALDYVDYFAIRRTIMGKLVTSRGRLRRVST